MFCTSLRQRPQWVPLVPRLATSNEMKWKESKLGGSHDIAFPIPEVRTTTNKCRIFCIMLLSPEDVESGAASWKMNRASNLNGGADVAVFFLLKYSGSCAGNGRHKTKVANGGGDDEGNRRKDPMAAFLELQIAAAQCDTMIPLIPVSSLNEMPEALASFRQTLETASPMDDDKQQLEATTTLLLKSCCVPEKPPLLEGQKDVLTSYVTESFADLAAKASSPEGQRELEQHLGEGDGRRVVDFFEAEIVLSG